MISESEHYEHKHQYKENNSRNMEQKDHQNINVIRSSNQMMQISPNLSPQAQKPAAETLSPNSSSQCPTTTSAVTTTASKLLDTIIPNRQIKLKLNIPSPSLNAVQPLNYYFAGKLSNNKYITRLKLISNLNKDKQNKLSSQRFQPGCQQQQAVTKQQICDGAESVPASVSKTTSLNGSGPGSLGDGICHIDDERKKSHTVIKNVFDVYKQALQKKNAQRAKQMQKINFVQQNKIVLANPANLSRQNTPQRKLVQSKMLTINKQQIIDNKDRQKIEFRLKYSFKHLQKRHNRRSSKLNSLLNSENSKSKYEKPAATATQKTQKHKWVSPYEKQKKSRKRNSMIDTTIKENTKYTILNKTSFNRQPIMKEKKSITQFYDNKNIECLPQINKLMSINQQNQQDNESIGYKLKHHWKYQTQAEQNRNQNRNQNYCNNFLPVNNILSSKQLYSSLCTKNQSQFSPNQSVSTIQFENIPSKPQNKTIFNQKKYISDRLQTLGIDIPKKNKMYLPQKQMNLSLFTEKKKKSYKLHTWESQNKRHQPRNKYSQGKIKTQNKIRSQIKINSINIAQSQSQSKDAQELQGWENDKKTQICEVTFYPTIE